MITDKKTRHIETHGVIDQSAYHIDEAAMGHITSILSNMYSDPALAVVREYFSNAVDAHTAAGKADRPVEIKLPTKMDPIFTARDYGNGLSIEGTKKLLGGYGASGDDKRASNDMIGGFGIGAKVGFAVSTAFNYTIFHEGRKRIWSCFLDEHDRGQLALLSDVESSEPSGIEITIPVPETYIDGFQSAADKAFLFAQVKPKLSGVAKGRASEVQITEAVGGYDLKLNIDGAEAVVRVAILNDVFTRQDDDDNSHNSCDDDYRVVIGNAGYSVDIAKIGLPDKLKASADKLLKNIRIVAPIGFLQVAPSREALQYSQRTIKVLRGMLEALLTPRIGLHLAESVAGVQAANADLSGLAVLSVGLDRLYGKGQSKSIIQASAKKYAGWIDDGKYVGITATMPDAVLETLTGVKMHAGGTQPKAMSYAFRVAPREAYNSNSHYDITRITVAQAILANYGVKGNQRDIFGCVLPVGASAEHDLYKRAGAILAARHEHMVKSGCSKTTPVYMIFWGISPDVTDDAACGRIMAASPFGTEGVIDFTLMKEAKGLIPEGTALLAQGYYGGYRLSHELEAPKGGQRTSWNSGNGAGATKIAAHSRKFVTPTEVPNANAQVASELWQAALAADVKNNGLVYLPLDEFRIASPGSNSMVSRSISTTAIFLTRLKNSNIIEVFDKRIQDCQLVGVRLSEVDSLKANPNYICFWEACRQIFSEAVKDQGLADAILVRVALDSDPGCTRKFLGLMQFVVKRGIRVSWYRDAERWAKAFQRAEAYAPADAGLIRLASACLELVQYRPMWDKAAVTSLILGTVKGTSLATVGYAFECSAEYNAAKDTPHVLVKLWERVVEEYPMIPYIIPALADECGHASPFGSSAEEPDLKGNEPMETRRCFVTFGEGSTGEDYLERYLKIMPALTGALDVVKPTTKRKQ